MVRNHPFVDGNKRIGAHAMLVFLALNGVELSYTQRELADIILQLAPVKKTMKNSWLGCLPIRCDTNIPIRVNPGTGICQKPGIDPNGIFFMCTDRVYPNDTLQSVCAANVLPDFLTRILRQSAQDLPAES